MFIVLLKLSAILVVGQRRARSQRVLDALCAQTAIDAMEIVVLDLVDDGTPPLTYPSHLSVIYKTDARHHTLAGARLAAFRHATAPIAAFIEDHAVPRRDWADALIKAHEGPWAAVGYAFENSNPQTYLSRSCMVNDYGQWMTPARGGERRILPGHNLSYKRDALIAFGVELANLLTPDFLLHRALRATGERLYLEPRAIVGHENFTRLPDAAKAHFTYLRMLAGIRARAGHWSWLRRIGYGIAVLPGAPAIALWRVYGSLRGRPSLVPLFLAALPLCVPIQLFAAVGESLGYLFGEGSAGRDMSYWESTAVRS